ncbi:hypothetical protein V6U81_27655 [Micromonospora sp. CPCC 205711]|uniref:hypothetical protein n=1 Tax=Micromonospora sp. CPCC 205547 TaxID=3122400 RepID=UPI002FEFC86D
MRWLAPLRAGDELAEVLSVLDTAVSATRRGCGTPFLRGELTRAGEAVLSTTFRACSDAARSASAARRDAP